MIRRSCARSLSVAAFLIASAMLAGCGDDDTPAICSSVDSLKGSVADVTDVDVDQNALPTLKDNLAQVQSDLSEVKTDAKDQYASEIDAVDQAASTVSSSIDAATASPSVQTLSDVGTAVKGLGTSLTTLDDAVSSTC